MACLNCKTLIELLHREIQELKDSERQLLQVNVTLQEASHQVQLDQHSDWKARYKDEFKKYEQMQQELRSMLMIESMSPIKEHSQEQYNRRLYQSYQS